MAATIALMDGAYFVGRTELLSWLNDFLKMNFTKVEETASGAAACQIMDAMFPGKVPLGKVNFNAKQEYEFLNNYKVLQTSFQKAGVDKFIPVDKLVKAKYQDNLEWLQWLKAFFDRTGASPEYDAVARRKEAGCNYPGDKAAGGSAKPAATTAAAPKRAAATSAAPAPTVAATTRTTTTTTTTAARTTTAAAPKPAAAEPDRRMSVAVGGGSRGVTSANSTKPAATSAGAAATDRRLSLARPVVDAQVTKLTQQVTELKLAVDNTEKERDFYYAKLCDIEELIERHKGDPLAAKIAAILFDGAEDNGGDKGTADAGAASEPAAAAVEEEQEEY
eukprot:TRINITY_DN11931_c0_g1_i1.p1 TRINITY_DN11931_c0_g1~~TRINITY_DN11931_c0_g1_i1.p1  ORF type:complete len:334 (+),score=125.60 TRINITY_DN11931_c0_g1_i1:54-1055(+)